MIGDELHEVGVSDHVLKRPTRPEDEHCDVVEHFVGNVYEAQQADSLVNANCNNEYLSTEYVG